MVDDLPALITQAREPFLWAYPTVQGLVAALEAAAKENERLTKLADSYRDLAGEQQTKWATRCTTAECERDALKSAARELLDLLDQGGTVEAFGAARLKLGALVEWTPAPAPDLCGND